MGLSRLEGEVPRVENGVVRFHDYVDTLLGEKHGSELGASVRLSLVTSVGREDGGHGGPAVAADSPNERVEARLIEAGSAGEQDGRVVNGVSGGDVRLLEQVRNEISLMCMVDSGKRELELVGKSDELVEVNALSRKRRNQSIVKKRP
jgi:hypothetical protein